MSARGRRVRRRVDVGDGLHLAVDHVDGSAPPLVLLHGFTGSAATWTSLRAALAPGRATLAVDLPGHGQSGVPADPARYALARTADDLARVLDASGIERAAVLGYSFGGRAALRFALAHPDRVAALVLESASPGIVGPAERATRVAADHALAEAIVRDGVPAFVDHWEQLPLWASQATLPATVRDRQRAQRLTNDARGLAHSLRGAGAGADAPVLDQLAALDVPGLLVVGARDAKYLASGTAMAHAWPAARLAIVPDTGHAVHLERPTAFAHVVRTFLDEVLGTGI